MSSTLEQLNTEPIIAIACQDKAGGFNILYCEEPIKLKDLDFQDHLLRIGDFYLLYEGFNSVVVCTEEILKELKEELSNA